MGQANSGNGRITFSFHPSFIGEQVNASIQALPNDVVRNSYVHTVFNYGKDPDNVFIYPSMGVPKFKTKLGDVSKTLKVGPVTGDVAYATGSGLAEQAQAQAQAQQMEAQAQAEQTWGEAERAGHALEQEEA